MKIEFKKGSKGGIELFLLGVIVIGAFFLVGGVGIFKKTPSKDSVGATQVLCCDSGNGDSCIPSSTDTITYAGTTYGRLRSETKFIEGNVHLEDSGQKATVNGTQYPIVLNSSQKDQNFPAGYSCGSNNNDKYISELPSGMSILDPRAINYCRETPNDMIIYVCKSGKCETASVCPPPGINYDPTTTSCYGDETSVYDAYFRLSDYNATTKQGVPDFIKNCSEKTSPVQIVGVGKQPQQIIVPTNVQHDNLQLNTFIVTEPGGQAIPWFSPFCKPAIYLYPEKTSQISVKVNPVGPFTYTDPLYPTSGWDVTAFPDGKIISNSKEFPYLYYEADIPSILIPKPETGYVINGSNLQVFLNDLLPKMGLNNKETQEMADYWADSLPKSPYYFVGIIPEKVLDSIAPLDIRPKPATTIRVALYFEALNTFEKVTAPTLISKERMGFSVVEWGGILKTDKPFVCLQ